MKIVREFWSYFRCPNCREAGEHWAVLRRSFHANQ